MQPYVAAPQSGASYTQADWESPVKYTELKNNAVTVLPVQVVY